MFLKQTQITKTCQILKLYDPLIANLKLLNIFYFLTIFIFIPLFETLKN